MAVHKMSFIAQFLAQCQAQSKCLIETDKQIYFISLGLKTFIL